MLVCVPEVVLDGDPEEEDRESLRELDAGLEPDPARRGFRQQPGAHPADFADRFRLRRALDREGGSFGPPTRLHEVGCTPCPAGLTSGGDGRSAFAHAICCGLNTLFIKM
jgi:hypothetical protein